MRRIMKVVVLSGLVLVLAVSCASTSIMKYGFVPSNSKIAVIPFRDCAIAGQEDCSGSGLTAGSIYTRLLFSRSDITAAPVARPVGTAEALTDADAVALAKAKGFDYVVNGDVTDFYRVAPMTFRQERAGVSVRLLNAQDGSLVIFQTEAGTASNLSTPERILEGLAAQFRDALSKK